MPGTVAEDFNQRGVVLINRVALHLEWFVFQGQGRSRRWGRGERRLCVVEGVGGESGGLERKNLIAPRWLPSYLGPRAAS